MGLIRILILFAVLWLLLRLVRRMLPPTRPGSSPQAGGRMVRCEQCGVYLPVGEAIGRDGRYYCSPEHREQAAGKGNDV